MYNLFLLTMLVVVVMVMMRERRKRRLFDDDEIYDDYDETDINKIGNRIYFEGQINLLISLSIY